VQFKQGDLVDVVEKALVESGLDPCLLELEITENVILHDTESTLATLQRLKSLGVHIAMDDFGTGYSSLSYLRRFPFDRIKIDRSFIQDVACNTGDAAIVRAVIQLGRSLGMAVTAEGVETELQLAHLRAQCCDEAQGFHLGRPSAIANFSPASLSSGRTIGHRSTSNEGLPRAATPADAASSLCRGDRSVPIERR
jgi:EAL domain-containing protein (putative c-di-GMP-specific phosphodiesterase class I)